MKCSSWIFAIFVLINQAAGDVVRKYDGMTRAEIVALLNSEGHQYQFITEKQFKTFIEAEVKPQPETGQRVSEKAAARAAVKSQSSSAAQKIAAIILLLDLDK